MPDTTLRGCSSSDGATSAYLGSAANMHLADASAAPERIDAALLDAFSVRVGGGFDLFACPRDPQAFSKVTPAAVLRLLEAACQVYDWLLLDLPRGRQPWTADVLAGSGAAAAFYFFKCLLPRNLAVQIYTALLENAASEQGALFEEIHARPSTARAARLAAAP